MLRGVHVLVAGIAATALFGLLRLGIPLPPENMFAQLLAGVRSDRAKASPMGLPESVVSPSVVSGPLVTKDHSVAVAEKPLVAVATMGARVATVLFRRCWSRRWSRQTCEEEGRD